MKRKTLNLIQNIITLIVFMFMSLASADLLARIINLDSESKSIMVGFLSPFIFLGIILYIYKLTKDK